VLGFWHNQAWMDMITRSFGPYQTNPLNINPLRDAIDALIDFDRVRACTDVEIFISATNVWTGKVAMFGRQELTADHLMASACLPTVFQAVEIDGVPYWDGGYMGNPALYPLYYESMTDDILLVQINPLERRQTRVHRSDAPRRALPQAHRSPALGTVPRRRRIHEIRRVLPRRHLGRACATAREPADRGRSPIRGAGPRLRRRGTAGGPSLAPACEGADHEAVDGQTPASPQSLRFRAVNSVAAQRTSSRR
jgi:predicted acylesterase/phospholipase RssA